MTRTARAAYPRAIIRDRSESKSGLDSSLRKGGAGRHNWGGIADERELEYAAMNDDMEFAEEGQEQGVKSTSAPSDEGKKPDIRRSTSSLSQEELKSAKDFRKNALKSKNIDLAAIARTSSAVSTSPPPPKATSIASTPTSV
ncbi:hypothetical protein AX17_006986 [Amanita inopinata Kibby_2008]|nr:hypothetical protein AX17_006986 [Amanita inopinata Kibby_2008]